MAGVARGRLGITRPATAALVLALALAATTVSGCGHQDHSGASGPATTYGPAPFVSTTTRPGQPATTTTSTASTVPIPTTSSTLGDTSAPAGYPSVTSFTASTATCRANSGATTITLSWRTSGASIVYLDNGPNAFLLADPRVAKGLVLAPNGSQQFPYPCADAVEFFRLGAYGTGPLNAQRSLEVDRA